MISINFLETHYILLLKLFAKTISDGKTVKG